MIYDSIVTASRGGRCSSQELWVAGPSLSWAARMTWCRNDCFTQEIIDVKCFHYFCDQFSSEGVTVAHVLLVHITVPLSSMRYRWRSGRRDRCRSSITRRVAMRVVLFLYGWSVLRGRELWLVVVVRLLLSAGQVRLWADDVLKGSWEGYNTTTVMEYGNLLPYM